MKENYYLDELVNAGMVMQVDGREYRFAELRVKDFAKMQEHLRRIQPKPSDLVAAALKDAGATREELGKAMVAAYEADIYWPASIDTKTGLHLVEKDQAARSSLVRYALEKHQPEITEGEARTIAESMTYRQWAIVATFVVSGRRPAEPKPDPKTEAEEESGQGEPKPESAATGTS